MEQILATVRSFDGVLDLAPGAGSEFPEIAWGDHFFYYAPDGGIPRDVQPFATIVTKDYPGDQRSDLDPVGRWRVNIHVGRTESAELAGEDNRNPAARDFSEADTIMPHPVYGPLGWIAVVNPGERTTATVVALLHAAHEDRRRRAVRRSRARADDDGPGADR